MHYKRILPNEKEIDRRWLLYSISSNKVFCFCCKLFKKRLGVQLANDGYNDWHNLSRCLASHETSREHMQCMTSWLEMERRLQKSQTIDASVQIQLNKEKEHWNLVLQRLIAIVQTLATNNLPFRGTCEKIYAENNGLFLQMVQLLGKFDPVIKEHLRRIIDHETYTTYLGKRIQNELIQMLGDEARKKILSKVKKAKFFSIILDCTPDISHTEQMSLVIRCLDESENSTKVEEYWIQFLEVNDSSGLGLFELLKDVLVTLKLDINDIRGQGYDNGSNMKGRHKGVQSRLLEINPRAFYTPCGCHSLNLALCDMANSCPQALSFFGLIQRIYSFFSSSVIRWGVFKDHVKGLTVKPLSQTRWESHVESVKPIKEQAAQIRDAFLEVAYSTKDPKKKSEAENLADNVENFEFLLGVIIWYKLLHAINIVSKYLQSENMDINIAINLLQGVTIFLEEYRKSGFDKAMVEAKEMASEMGIEAVFREKRIVQRKKHFDESSTTEVVLSPEESFRVNYFLFIVDQARSSIETRFAQFKNYDEMFGFLFSMDRLHRMDDESLLMFCKKLEKFLEHNCRSDIDGEYLFSELTFLKFSLPDESKSAIDILNYLKRWMVVFHMFMLLTRFCLQYQLQ